MRLFLMLLLGMFLNVSYAENTVILNSEANDPVFEGQAASFSAVEIDYAYNNNFRILVDDLSFQFEAPDNDNLFKPQVYNNVSRWNSNTRAGMRVEKMTSGLSCYDGVGEFYIYEYQPADTVALDFTYYCDPDNNSGSNALHGSIRINSTLAIPYQSPIAVIHGESRSTEGSTISLDGSASFIKDSEIDSYLWEQTAGPVAELLNPQASQPMIKLPTDIQLGGETLTFRLTVTGQNEATHTADHNMTVSSKSDAYTYLQMTSSEHDYIGQGRNWFYAPSNASFSIRSSSNGVTVSLNDGNHVYWNADFAAPDDEQLQVGVYGFAERYPFQSDGTAGLSVSGDGRGCNTLTGSFVVKRVTYKEDNTPRSFEATFDQYCEGGSAVLSGTIAYNVTHESVPTAEAGELIEVKEMEPVNLNGSGSFDNIGQIASYRWSTTTDDILINNEDQSRANFIAPLLGNRESSRIIPLRLFITDDEGYQAEDWVNVKVLSANTAPVANQDQYTVSLDSNVTLTPLNNDDDNDGIIALDSIELVTKPAHGNAIINSNGSIVYYPKASHPGYDTLRYTVKDNDGATSNIATIDIRSDIAPPPSLTVRAFLQGAYEAGTNMMHDTLRTSYLLPTIQPYENSGLFYAGAEGMDSRYLNTQGPTAPVDWVLLELRSDASPTTSTIIERKALLIQRNGYLFERTPGENIINFLSLVPGSYFVALYHRNHLVVTTSQAIDLSASEVVIDFTLPDTPVRAGSRYIEDGVAMLWAGDIGIDQRIIASGPGNDNAEVFRTVLMDEENTSANSNYVVWGYQDSDLNLDGKTIYTGPGNDVQLILQNILSHPDNDNLASNYTIKNDD